MRSKVKIEKMENFFNKKAKEYEKHMEKNVVSFDKYYKSISEPIERTEKPIKILDLGCGTGLEINGILEKTPNAKITCVDMTKAMTDILLETYKDHKKQITIINDSYLTMDFEENTYDYVIGVMTMHHFTYVEKVVLYTKIKRALKKNGRYIEGDYYVSLEDEKELLKRYYDLRKEYEDDEYGLYHIDIPFALETQQGLLNEAGFGKLQLIWDGGEQKVYSV